MTTVIEKLFSREKEAAETAAEVYAGTVAAIADGNDLDAAEVEAALVAAGKTLRDLANDVNAQKRRDAIAAEIDQVEAAKSEMPQIERQLAEAHAEFETAKRRHDSTVMRLNLRRQQIVDQVAQAEANRRNRVESAPQILRERRRSLQLAINRLDNEIFKLKNGGAGRKAQLDAALARRAALSSQLNGLVAEMQGAG